MNIVQYLNCNEFKNFNDVLFSFIDESGQKDSEIYKKVDIDFNKFRRNIINGIENYFDEWVNWNMCDNNKILKNRKIELEEKINKAKELLKDMR